MRPTSAIIRFDNIVIKVSAVDIKTLLFLQYFFEYSKNVIITSIFCLSFGEGQDRLCPMFQADWVVVEGIVRVKPITEMD